MQFNFADIIRVIRETFSALVANTFLAIVPMGIAALMFGLMMKHIINPPMAWGKRILEGKPKSLKMLLWEFLKGVGIVIVITLLSILFVIVTQYFVISKTIQANREIYGRNKRLIEQF